MSWLPHGPTPTGRLQASSGQDPFRSKAAPAVAAHRGRLWLLWTDLEGSTWFAATTTTAQNGGFGFGKKEPFPVRRGGGLPVVANLDGMLHAILVDEAGGGEMAHYVYDADDKLAWDCLADSLSETTGAVAHSTPALAAFHNKLFLVYLNQGRLFYAVWSVFDQKWTEPLPLCEQRQERAFAGVPALFVIDGVLNMLCAADTPERNIMGYRYDYISSTWLQREDVSEGRAASGVSAASYGGNAYLGFIEHGPGDESHAVYIAAYQKEQWQPQESVGGASAADPPQIAILNGRMHVFFNDRTETRDLRWYSRPVLDYSLSDWMGSVPDDTLLSAMTIPGTHDSCARSNIPFVRTQYLSVAQQLALGIRFLDLRLRRHDDGKLFCYHGGVPIDLPKGLSFETAMDEVWAFIHPEGKSTPPTETVLISINNDDPSKAQKDNPAVFYDAVADAIANTPPYADGGHRWHVEPVTARLGDVRGKAVLLRRYQGHADVAPPERLGLDLSEWQDDNADFTIVTPTNVRVRLQDKWKYAERIALHDLVASKSSHVQRMMARATRSFMRPALERNVREEKEDVENVEADSAPETWYINFCSAVGDPTEHGEVAEPKWIAVGAHSNIIGKWINGMNVLTRDYLQRGDAGRRRLGIVNLDYPELPQDNDVVARLIETNF